MEAITSAVREAGDAFPFPCASPADSPLRRRSARRISGIRREATGVRSVRLVQDDIWINPRANFLWLVCPDGYVGQVSVHGGRLRRGRRSAHFSPLTQPYEFDVARVRDDCAHTRGSLAQGRS